MEMNNLEFEDAPLSVLESEMNMGKLCRWNSEILNHDGLNIGSGRF
jgi:hypothetical protein